MTVESTDRKQIFAGGQADHDFTFRAFPSYPSDINCLKTLISTGAETDLTYDVDYTVTVASDGIGGTVTLNPTVSTLYTVTVYRVTTDKQESDYDDYNQFPADTVENDFDRRTMISQERAEEVARTVKLPISSTGSATLPLPEADQIIGWNAAADGLENKEPATLDFISVSADTALGTSDSVVPTQKAVKTYVDARADGSVNPTNLLSNGDFESWRAGASNAPDGWTSTGTIAQEASLIKLGTYAVKITQGTLSQTIHTAKGIAYWKGRTVTFSCWVKSSDIGRLSIDDGVASTESSNETTGTYTFLTVTRTIDSSATQVNLICTTSGGGAIAYFDGAMCVEGSSAFAFSPKPAEELNWQDSFGYSTIVGWAAGKTGTIYTKKIGKTVFVKFIINGTSNGAVSSMTLPYASASTSSFYGAGGYGIDNGSALTTPFGIEMSVSTSTVTFHKTMAMANGWTASAEKSCWGNFWYESA